jgi:hypothetical protein
VAEVLGDSDLGRAIVNIRNLDFLAGIGHKVPIPIVVLPATPESLFDDVSGVGCILPGNSKLFLSPLPVEVEKFTLYFLTSPV